MEHMKAYGAHPPPPPQQHFNHGPSQHQNPSSPPPAPRQLPRRDFVQINSHNTTNTMSSTFATFPAYETSDLMPWGPSNGTMMAMNNGFPLRHPSSPPQPQSMPSFHQFQPPPPPTSSYFTSNGPVSGYQSHIPAGMVSPLHSPPLGPVGMHMGAPSFAPHNAHMAYQNILPPQDLSSRGQQQQQQQQQQHQMPPRPNFMYQPNGGMQRDHSGPGGHMSSYMPNMTPPVSVPSSPSPQPGYLTRMDTNQTPPPNGHSLSPLILSTTLASNPTHNSSYRSTNVPNATYSPSTVPRTVPARASPLSSSVLVASSTTLQGLRDDMSSSPKPRLNPDASPFMPVVKSPAIVSSTPPPPPKGPAAMRNGSGTPPTRPRAHPFSQQQDEEEKRTFNPAAPAFVPPSASPPLNAPTGPRMLSRTPPPNAPTGPSSMTSKGNRTPPTGPAAGSPVTRSGSFSRLSLSPPTGPRAERERNIPPPPSFGIEGAVSRGLPANTPSGPRALNKPSTPSGPRSMTSTPNGPRSMTPTNGRPMTPTGPARHNSLARHPSSYKPNSTLAPVVAKTIIDGIDKPVPTAPASMLEGLAPAASIVGVPTAPKAMREAAAAIAVAAASVSGSDDGRSRPEVLSEINITNSLIYPQRRSYMRKALSERDGSVGSITPAQTPIQLPTAMSVEVKVEDVLKKVDEEQLTVLSEKAVAEEEEEEKVVEEIVVPLAEPIDEEVSLIELTQPVEELISISPVEVVSTEEKTESEADTIVVTPDCEVLPLTSPFMVKAIDEKIAEPIPEVAEVVEIVEAAPAPAVLPVIQIESEDLSLKAVDLAKEVGLPRPSSGRTQRLSEISKEQDKDIIVSMKIEDGVVLVPMETPDMIARTFAKTPTFKAKEETTVEEKAIAITEPVEVAAALAATAAATVAVVSNGSAKRKESKKSAGPKPTPTPAVNAKYDLTKRSKTKQSRKKQGKASKATPTTEETSTPAAAEVSEPKTDVEDVAVAPVVAFVAPSTPKGTATSCVKNTQVDVGFVEDTKAAEEDDVIVEQAEVATVAVETVKAVAQEIQEKPIKEAVNVKDAETNEDDVVEVTVAKATVEEVEQEGGVSLDITETEPVAIALPLSPVEEVIAVVDKPSVVEVEEIKALPVVAEVAEKTIPSVTEKPVEVIAPVVEKEAEIVVPVVEKQAEVIVPVVEKVLAPVTEEKPITISEEVKKPVESVAVAEKPQEVSLPAAPVEKDQLVVELVEAEELSPVLEQLVEFFQPCYVEEEAVESDEPAAADSSLETVMMEPRQVEETTVSIDSIIGTLSGCKDVTSLSKSLDSYSKVVKPGSQEERLFKELAHYTISSSPMGAVDNDDKASTRSKRSIRNFFRRGEDAYSGVLSSTTKRIKAILPPFLSVSAGPQATLAATPPPSRPISAMGLHHSASTSTKPSRPRLLPKVTMSLLRSSSFSIKSRSGSFNQ